MEIELKFLVDPRNVNNLLRHPLLRQYAITRLRNQALTSTYFDTPDLQLQRHHASLRIRHADRAWIQTFKCGGEVRAALHRRNEWETPVKRQVLDLAALHRLVDKDACGGKLIRERRVTQNLAPVFSTKVIRTLRKLRLPNGLEIECALDRGIIEYGALQEPICELELEYIGGDAGLLFDFALQLLDTVPMRIGSRSKAERGYALCQPQAIAVKADVVKLHPRMSVEQGFQKIVTDCITHIQQNEPGVVEHRDPEAVHQMRVGLRRLRSALRLFENIVPAHDNMAEEFRWFAEQLGAARDWDVLAGGTLPAVIEKVQDGTDLAILQDAATGIARKKRNAVASTIASARYAQLILRFTQWVQRAGWRDHLAKKERAQLSQPMNKFSERMLAREQATLLKRGKLLRKADAPMRHRIRIAAKKTRYASEFFQSLYRPRQVRRYVTALSALQDELGLLHDATVADGLLRELGTRQKTLAASSAYARGSLDVQAALEERKLRKRWQQFASVALPCRKPA